MTSKKKQVLLAEDDPDVLRKLKKELERTGLLVLETGTVLHALELLAQHHGSLAAAILDLNLAPGGGSLDALGDHGKIQPNGYALASFIDVTYPKLPLLGMTGLPEGVTPECNSWFQERGGPEHANGVYHKYRQWALLRRRVCKLANCKTKVRVFITHGHETTALKRLVDLARSFQFDPVTLGESQWGNNTWIEKFEMEVARADLAWVLCTEDETAVPFRRECRAERRPRPNVLVELGYFLGLYERKSLRVYLFQAGEADIGSNLDGVGRILMDDHLETRAREQLRPWL